MNEKKNGMSARGRVSRQRKQHMQITYSWMKNDVFKKVKVVGTWVAQSVRCLPLARVMIPGSGIESHIREPAFLSAPSLCSFSLSLKDK